MTHGGIEDERIIAQRIVAAEAEKRKTCGEILKDGLFGPGDKRLKRGKGKQFIKRARPKLKADAAKTTSEAIEGRPRTGKTHW